MAVIEPSDHDLTALLNAWVQGDVDARDRLFEQVYPTIRSIVLQQRRSAGPLTLDATEVANEVYLRLNKGQRHEWQHRAQFFRLIAIAVRQVLVDYVRNRQAAKRGGGWRRSEVVLEHLPEPDRAIEVLRLNESLTRLAEIDAVAAEIVELKVFAGQTIPELSRILGISTATVSRRWEVARAWLRRELDERQGGSS